MHRDHRHRLSTARVGNVFITRIGLCLHTDNKLFIMFTGNIMIGLALFPHTHTHTITRNIRIIVIYARQTSARIFCKRMRAPNNKALIINHQVLPRPHGGTGGHGLGPDAGGGGGSSNAKWNYNLIVTHRHGPNQNIGVLLVV